MPQGQMMRKGTYILIMEMSECDVEVGSLGVLHFTKGSYCYVGSAMNGLDQRISRHLSKDKKIRWHIDRLTTSCTDIVAYECISHGIRECELCDIVIESGGIPVFKGFGCSDCKCRTHLFFVDEMTRKRLCSDGHFAPYPNICNCTDQSS